MKGSAIVRRLGALAQSQRQLAIAALIAATIKVLAAFLAFLMLVVFARVTSSDGFAVFAVAFSLGQFIVPFSLYGQHIQILKELSSDGETGQLRQLARRAAITSAGVSVACAALIVVDRLDGDWNPGLYLAVALVPLLAMAELLSSALRAKGQVFLALAPRDVFWRALAILAVLTFVPGSNGWDATGLILLLACVMGGLVIFQLIAFAILWRKVEKETTRQDAEAADTSSAAGFWIWIGTVIGPASAHLVTPLVSPILDDVQLGAFFAALKTATLLSLPVLAVNLAIAPAIAKAWKAADDPGTSIQRICGFAAIAMTVPTVLILVPLVTAPGMLLSLFSADFTIASTALVILAIVNLINAVFGPTNYLLLMTGRERAFAVFMAVANLTGLVCAALGAMGFGITGAAAGYGMGVIIWNLLAAWWARRALGIDPTLLGARAALSER